MIKWICKKFDELSPFEMYAIHQLRNEVFVVEQQCPYQDADNKDIPAYHIMGWVDDKLAAYTRLLPPNVGFKEQSIGRVVTSPLFRKKGFGKKIMLLSIDKSKKIFGNNTIRIGAQFYLMQFYGSLGFSSVGEVYLEDNIAHIEMILT